MTRAGGFAELTIVHGATGGLRAYVDGKPLGGVYDVAIGNDDASGRTSTVTIRLRGRRVGIADVAPGGDA